MWTKVQLNWGTAGRVVRIAAGGREASPLHTIDRARHKDSTTPSPFSPPTTQPIDRWPPTFHPKELLPTSTLKQPLCWLNGGHFCFSKYGNATPFLFIEYFEGIFHFEDTQVLNQRGLWDPMRAVSRIPEKDCFEMSFYQQLGLGLRSHLVHADPYNFFETLATRTCYDTPLLLLLCVCLYVSNFVF